MTAPEPIHHLALFAASPTPMLLVDHEAGVIVEANPAAARFYGYSLRAMQGMPVSTLSPEAPHRLRQVALNATGALSFVVDHRLASGQVQKVAIGSSLVAVDDKPLVYSVIRPAAEVASEREIADLRESERRYRDLVEHLGAGVVLFDPDGNPTWVNETMASMLGHTRDELLALGNAVVVGPTSSGWSPRTLEALTEQASLRYDLVFRHRDGHHLTGEVRARRIHEGAIEAVIHDVTAQRAAAAARKALESERDRLALALDQSSDVVILTDLRGMTTYVNRAFERMYGMPRTDVIGARATRWLVRLSDSDPATRIFATLRTTGHWHGDIRQRRRDGTRFTASAHIALVRDPGGEPIGYLGIARDVTHERAVAERMAESAKIDAVEQLAGGVAHAFNNLLTGVLGYAQLAASAPSGDPALAEDLREIMDAAHRAQALTRQLLAFGRRSHHNPRVLDPVGAVAALGPGLRQLAGNAVALELEEGPGTGPIRVDPTLLEHALVGLVENAREAMPRGGRIRIEIGAPTTGDDAPPGRWAAIRVQDSGPGMDGPTRTRALEPFFSTKQVAGAGLGLPMVNGFAIRSGGHLRVRSVPGAGTEVTLLLPLVTAESAAEIAAPVPGSAADQSEGHAARRAARHAADPAAGQAADPGPAGPTVIADPSSGGQPATVLVVDDEAVLRAIAERVMVGAGHRVLLAASGEEALEVAARAGRIDLLFTDIVMPGMHGIDLAAALRATRPDLRVLVTSGFTPDDIDRRGVGLAETPFLPKPYTPAELREAVATELRRGAKTGSG